MHRVSSQLGVVATMLTVCVVPSPTASRAAQASTAPLSELWLEPEPDRDLFYGPGGPRLAPNPSDVYKVIKIKEGGFSDGYTVLDPRQRQWSTKLYPEARTEVV